MFESKISRILAKKFWFTASPAFFAHYLSPLCNKFFFKPSKRASLIVLNTTNFYGQNINKGAIPVAMLLLSDYEGTLSSTSAVAGQLNVRSESVMMQEEKKESGYSRPVKCIFCQSSHMLQECKMFQQKSYSK